LKAAIEVPHWAFHFYLKHFKIIAGLSLIPAVERFILLFFEPDLSTTTLILLEIFTEGTRLLLLWLIIKFAISQDRKLREVKKKERWRRVKSFVKYRWVNLIFQIILMFIATLIFDFFLEQVIGNLIPDYFQNKYIAILLAIKNPTVIAWFFVWLIGIPKQMMRFSSEESKKGIYVSII
ncbi:hypothetical protein G5B00_17600, partial [Parapedobacter sp. SGR-10]|uniref:hypothetical protein n=1 Tax=Parapedobacter sp. SGR-10 TaxID=2710879 RepID=UPI0013D1A5BD